MVHSRDAQDGDHNSRLKQLTVVVLDRHPSREQSAVLGSRRQGTQRMLGPLPSPFATPVTCGLREGVLGHIVHTLAQVARSLFTTFRNLLE